MHLVSSDGAAAASDLDEQLEPFAVKLQQLEEIGWLETVHRQLPLLAYSLVTLCERLILRKEGVGCQLSTASRCLVDTKGIVKALPGGASSGPEK